MHPAKLSRELRTRDSEHLEGRRRVLQLALGSAACMGVVSLYQMGVIGHLPEPPVPLLNADEVDASPEAYAYFSTPDAVLGFASYAGTMVLASMGEPDRPRTRPWIPLALGAKALADAAQAGKLTIDQWTKHRLRLVSARGRVDIRDARGSSAGGAGGAADRQVELSREV